MSFLIRQTLIYAVPLMIVALAGIFSERSGIINLALEGMMIFGAFIGVLFVRILQQYGVFDAAKANGDWWSLQGFMFMTMLVAAALGALFSLLLAFASINLKADQTIGGTALNMMAPALVLFFVRMIANQNTLQMYTGDSASWFMLKKSMFGYGRSEEMSFLGDTFLNKVYLATYVCIIVYIVLSIILYKTRFGLRLRACGENPHAADSLGINVKEDALRGRNHLGCAGGHGRFCIRADDDELHLKRRCSGLWFPCAGGHDLRQLEAAQRSGRGTPIRPIQVHSGLLLQPGHKRRRRLHAKRPGHKPPLLPPAPLPDNPYSPRFYLQKLPRPQGRGHTLREKRQVTGEERWGVTCSFFSEEKERTRRKVDLAFLPRVQLSSVVLGELYIGSIDCSSFAADSV